MKVTIRLRPDKDQDLIKWVSRLEKGERSRFIRLALKKVVSKRLM